MLAYNSVLVLLWGFMYFLALYNLMSKLILSWKVNGKSALKLPLHFLERGVNIQKRHNLNNFFGDLKKDIHTEGQEESLAACIGRKPRALLNQMPSGEQHVVFSSRCEAESITLLGANHISSSICNDHRLS